MFYIYIYITNYILYMYIYIYILYIIYSKKQSYSRIIFIYINMSILTDITKF